MDIINEITRSHRELHESGETKTLVLTRRYDAGTEDVWDACTNAERISRWMLPITGDLRLGGNYQLKDNAGGEILHCERPSLLKVTWAYGPGPASEVEVRLTAEDGGTLFELRHTAVPPPDMWSQFGPGAVGIGWDLALLGLSMHLTGGMIPDHDRMHETEEGRQFITESSQAWGEAFLAAGATAEHAAAATKATTAFYAPTPE
ncbi:SRPBCC family protein [Nonomuraea sp. LPB2021202275-12-8]|uniref:SRPBCC family protein n=1 Tax=Nonomuraea sp. LPB2021202275-12-8 TaxID=3120159 RepID=UPI00300D7927